MVEPVALLKDKRAKLAARVKKAQAALDAAKAELDETETAIRVLVRMGLATDDETPTPSGPPITEAQKLVLSALETDPDKGRSPKEVLEVLKSKGVEMNPDYVRTALWRLAKRELVSTANSVYWKVTSTGDGANPSPKNETPDAETPGVSGRSGRVAELEDPEKSEQRPFRKGENVGSSPTPPSSDSDVPDLTHWDSDDDVPF